jgi:3-hydroxymyristoyl/3-hydroxydecanoyl-(acyl carrier protein) dehydratase
MALRGGGLRICLETPPPAAGKRRSEPDGRAVSPSASTRVHERRAVEPPKGAAVVVALGTKPLPAPLPPRGPAVIGAASSKRRPDNLSEAVARSAAATAAAHDAFLRFSKTAAEGFTQTIALQSQLLQAVGVATEPGVDKPDAGETAPEMMATHEGKPGGMPEQASQGPVYSRQQCVEFAVGSVAKVLGPEFAEVDAYPVRVRLPAEPLMLVDRIVHLEGVKNSLGPGRIVTEHDVLPDAWYLDGDRCPPCITIEAGQADLFLCAYLGIDRAVHGRRSYRLLDATVTFHRGLPRPGEAVRYDIRIDRFVRQGDVHLFFFEFDGTIDGRPMVTMRKGCAGFFTPEEIEHSGGIVLTADDTAAAPGRRPADWRELVPTSVASYGDAALAALRAGDLAGCFGPAFEGLPLEDPLRLPGGRMKLIDRIQQLDPTGGRYGFGVIRGEADIHPNDWFLTCHFVDDMVMPGTLMYECSLHTLRFFLLRMGWVGERSEAAFEPVPGVPGSLKCRGPVTPRTGKAAYQVDIKEIDWHPRPYVIADALMFADGKRIVQIKNMALQLSGTTREKIEALWRDRGDRGDGLVTDDENSRRRRRFSHGGSTGFTEAGSVSAAAVRSPSRSVVLDKGQLLAFATGKPSEAFGEPYKRFDQERRMARLPAPPFLFLDRVTACEPPAWKLEPGGWVETEYDVPPNAWYFRANRQLTMPFFVVQEIALQSCGWLAAYMGSALKSEADLFFRNLGGTATLHAEVHRDAGTLTGKVRLLSASQAGDTIIEKFEVQVWQKDRLIYDGTTTFGFFSEAALAWQIGLRQHTDRAWRPSLEAEARGHQVDLEDLPPQTPDDPRDSPASSPAMPARALRMIDRVELLIPDGGPHGLGYVRAVADVDPLAWFFKAHFLQDPVWPGSLGLESFLQALKVVALNRWGAQFRRTHRFEAIAAGVPHTWLYRGQVLPTHRRVEVEVVITQRRDSPEPFLLAGGFLKVDGTHIYKMIDFGLRLVDNGGSSS